MRRYHPTGPEGLATCSCCSADSPQEWCLRVALGTWRGLEGKVGRSAWQALGHRSWALKARAGVCGLWALTWAGPLFFPAQGPGGPQAQEPWDKAGLVAARGSPALAPLRGGTPQWGVYIMFLGVHRSLAPTTGWAVFMDGRGQWAGSCIPSSAWYQAHSAQWLLDMLLPPQSYLRTFGSLAICTY
jgi:hypothetical protein